MGCILPRCLLSNKIIGNLTACNLSGEAESCIEGTINSQRALGRIFLAFPVPEVGQESCHSHSSV